MKLRTVLGSLALLLAAAMPATSLGQRSHSRSYGRGTLGRGPYYPSQLFGNGYRNHDGRSLRPFRIGGVQVYFPPSRSYGYRDPALGYYYGYAPYGGYPLPLGYGYPYYGY